jgi:hypothetical protein
LHLQRDGREAHAHDADMEATTKLQKAGRAFLLRLVAEYAPGIPEVCLVCGVAGSEEESRELTKWGSP